MIINVANPDLFLLNKSSRKPFSKSEYDKFNSMAFDKLKEDLPGFYIDQPEENYGIDTFAYQSEIAFKRGDAPLFAIELEAKKSGGWGEGDYPYPTVHFLARKAKNRVQDCVPFWVQYNEDGSNALVLPISYVFSYPLKQMWGAKSFNGDGSMVKSNDYYYDIALDACSFQRGKIQDAILEYYRAVANKPEVTIEDMREVNRIYRTMIAPATLGQEPTAQAVAA